MRQTLEAVKQSHPDRNPLYRPRPSRLRGGVRYNPSFRAGKEIGMRKVALLGTAVLLVFTLNLYAGQEHEKALKDMIESLKQMSDALEKVSDEATAKEAKPKLKTALTQFQKVKEQVDKLKEPTKEEKEKLEKQYKGDLEGALKKLLGEIVRVSGVPGGKELVQELRAVTK